ncbi:03351adf-8b9e-453b-92a7-755ac27df3ac [Thermothielavioides terrestris]|uniref:03351adf-8b9e-453b-92a7-755ac27df3ac n=1 Tax=Thermothielavioides terrestris TaxID=2587410 RepID=A0A3S5CWQ9_9PEZI|nr:03351adf-8b9e-453b-92a7-755ac27df3ac [Thermothielavioides terrestris]
MAHVAKIPVIDVSGDGDQAQVARELVDAAVEHGFVYIRNTGKDIPVEAIDAAFEMSRRLFDAPLSEKQACTIQQNNRGWSAMNYETLDPANQRVGDFKEAFNFGEFVDGKAQQPIPPTIAADEPQISAFRDLCYNLSLKLNTLLGIGLEACPHSALPPFPFRLPVTPPDFFTAAHLRARGPSGTILRFLRYPPRSDLSDTTAADVRAGAHSDYGSLTLLFRLRGQPGLEVLARDGVTWMPVPVVPPGTEHDPAPPILMNIGDLLSYWTNGLLRSTVHRVVFPGPAAGAAASSGGANGGEGEEGGAAGGGIGVRVEGEVDDGPRYSIAYFCHPFGGAELGPVPNEHLQMRLRASYAQLYKGKE